MSTTQKSFWLTKEAGEAQREWYIVDMQGQTLGRAASKIASVLRGKHKPTYSPNVDMGDFVIVINAGGSKLTGNKIDGKLYYKHTLYPGGLKTRTAKQVIADDPARHPRGGVGHAAQGPAGPPHHQEAQDLRAPRTTTARRSRAPDDEA
jgi:ribosomal protein L13